MAARTPLYETHLKYGGRIVEFAGWDMPVQYEGIIAEHKAVREKAGLFDVSHMGEVTHKGPNAEKQLQYLLTNDFSQMKPGDIHYSPMCYETGGTVDDVLVYKLAESDFLVVVNASNKDKDVQWMLGNNKYGAAIEDVSDKFAELALQGPKAEEILRKLVDASRLPEKYYTFIQTKLYDHPCLISRTGYTGEDGFEVYLQPGDAPRLWDELMKKGEALGLVPCGLGARDTLRLEAAMPLYGHELTQDISPLEAGLGRFVKLDKEEFIGREALAKQKAEGLKRRRCGLEILEKGIAREGAPVLLHGQPIGSVTSGTMAPWLGRPITMAMIAAEQAVAGNTVEVAVRGRILPAMIVKLPFYRRQEDKK
jgi:aminomethyltransferase